MDLESLTLYKLMILDMLDNLNFPLTNSQLSEFFVGQEYTTYFQTQQAINELIEADFIRPAVMRNTTSYYLSAAGEAAVSMFGSQIPDSIKQDILTYFKDHKYELRRHAQYSADFFSLNNGEYMVKTTIKERGNILMELGLNVVSREQAIAVCDQWSHKCERVYQTVMEELLLNDDTTSEEELNELSLEEVDSVDDISEASKDSPSESPLKASENTLEDSEE